MYDFRKLIAAHDLEFKISVNGKYVDLKSAFKKVENLTITQKYGIIDFPFPVNLDGVKLKEIVTLKKGELIFSDNFAKINQNYFNNRGFINVTFFDYIPKHSNKEIKEGLEVHLIEVLSIEEGKINLKLNNFGKIDINAIEIEKFGENTESLLNELSKSNKRQENSYSPRPIFCNNNEENDEMDKDNETSQVYDYQAKNLKVDLNNTDDYIDNQKIKFPIKFPSNEIINPFDSPKNYTSKQSKLIRNNPCCRVAFNHHGNFAVLGKLNQDSFNYNLMINKIIPNKSIIEINKKNLQQKPINLMNLMQNIRVNDNIEINHFNNKSNCDSDLLYDKVKSLYDLNFNVFIGYLLQSLKLGPIFQSNFYYNEKPINNNFQNLKITEIKSEKNNFKKPKNFDSLGLIEYSEILRNMILKYENSLKNFNESNSSEFSFYINKQIDILRLTEVLFLNPFISRSGDIIQKQINSNSENILKARKKSITEWLVITSKNEYSIDLEKIKRSNYDKNSLNYKEIFINLTYGRIVESIKNSKINNEKFLCQLISCHNNNKLLKKTLESMNYCFSSQELNSNLLNLINLLNGSEENILTDLGWKRILISLCIYYFPNQVDFKIIIEVLEKLLGKGIKNDKNLPLEFYLIKFYSSLDFQYIKQIMNLKLYNGINSDHLIQFIILTVLKNILKETYSFEAKLEKESFEAKLEKESFEAKLEKNSLDAKLGKKIDNIILNIKKLQLIFFHKVLEELVLFGFWDLAIKFIYLSNLENHIFESLIKEIYLKLSYEINEEIDILEYQKIDSLRDLDANFNFYYLEGLGVKYNYKNKVEIALKKFRDCKDHAKVFNIIFLNIIPEIIVNRSEIKNEIRIIMDEFNKNKNKIPNWNQIGIAFINYFQLLDKTKINDKNFNDNLLETINKINNIPDKSPILLNCKNRMLKNLRKMFNDSIEKINDEKFMKVIVPNNNWINSSTISYEFKKSEFMDSLKSVIKFQSKQYTL